MSWMDDLATKQTLVQYFKITQKINRSLRRRDLLEGEKKKKKQCKVRLHNSPVPIRFMCYQV